MSNPFQIPLLRLGRAIIAARPQIIHAMGNDAIKFVHDNFRLQGFQDTTFVPWKLRSKNTDKNKNLNRSLLIKTGNLRRAWKATEDPESVTISNDLPYAFIHNEGGTINHPYREATLNYAAAKGGKLRLAPVRTEAQQRHISTIRRVSIYHHVTNMPQRRMMGLSPVLDRMTQASILQILNNQLNNV